MNLGERIIEEIVNQAMFRVSCPDPEDHHVFVWSSGAAEQLEAVVGEELTRLRNERDQAERKLNDCLVENDKLKRRLAKLENRK